MIQLILYCILLFAIESEASTLEEANDSLDVAAEARLLVRQAKWATFSTMSAFGYPTTTVLSTAEINGEIYFFMLNTDIPAMDTNMDIRITFTFSDVEGDSQNPTRAMITGHVKKLESGTEHNRGSKAFSLHHPEASEWVKSSYTNFSLCKLDVTNVIVLLEVGGVFQLTPQEYYAETVFVAMYAPIVSAFDLAMEARPIVHRAKWATLTTILADGYPRTTVLLTADRRNTFLSPAIDTSNGDRITLMFSDPEEIDCNLIGDDPWSPNCAKVVISGNVEKVYMNKRSMERILTQHPNASELINTSTSHNLYLYKFNMTDVVVLLRGGGIGQITPEEYANLRHSEENYNYDNCRHTDHINIDSAAVARQLVNGGNTATYRNSKNNSDEEAIKFMTTERKGKIYFFVRNLDKQALYTFKNNPIVFTGDYDRDYCPRPGYGRAMIWGRVQKLDVDTEEYDHAMNIFLRIPHRKEEFKSYNLKLDFFMCKLDITRIKVELLDRDTSRFVTSQEYYAGTESVHTTCDCCDVNKLITEG